MKCPWCSNLNYLPEATCAHCGEELSPRLDPEPGEQPADHGESTEDDASRAHTIAVSKSFAVSAVAVAVLAVGGITTIHHWPVTAMLEAIPKPTPTSPPPAADPYGQIVAMNGLLRSIKATRSQLPDTLGSCANVDSDAEALSGVVQERSDQLNEATNLPVNALKGGEPLKQALVDMAQMTLNTDQMYLTWAQNSVGGFCTDAAGSDFDQANQDAANAKRRFLKQWRIMASPFDEPKYKWTDF